MLDDSRAPFFRWFAGGELNTCYNALDRHVAGGRADQVALIYDSPVTGTVQTFTFREMLDLVSRFAGALGRLGVRRPRRIVVVERIPRNTAQGKLQRGELMQALGAALGIAVTNAPRG
mgnify:CR=1 FL=1